MIIDKLVKLGLNKEESQVYLACLESGDLSVTDISQKTGITRTTLYAPIKLLLEKKLLTYVVHKKRKLLKAKPISILNHTIDQELKLNTEKKEILNNLVLSLEKKIHNTPNGSIEIVDGKNGVDYLISSILSSKSNFYWIGSFSSVLSTIDKESLYKLLTWKRMDGDTTSYAISDSTLMDYSKFSDRIGKFRELKILKEEITIPGIIIVFADNIAFVSISKRGKVKIYIIHDSLCSDFYKFTYLELWKRLL